VISGTHPPKYHVAANARRCMTLVELLVGMTLVVALLGFGFAAVREMNEVWGRGRNRFDTRHTARKIVERLSGDLRCAVRADAAAPFVGEPDSLRFPATVRKPGVADAPPVLIVDYSVVTSETGSGLRRRLSTPEGEFVGERIETGVAAIAAAYRHPDGSWADRWEGTVPPTAVRIEVRAAPPDNGSPAPAFPVLVTIPSGGRP